MSKWDFQIYTDKQATTNQSDNEMVDKLQKKAGVLDVATQKTVATERRAQKAQEIPRAESGNREVLESQDLIGVSDHQRS